MLRYYKPERSHREEQFVPGVDPGVRDWLVVRQAGRDAQLRGSTHAIVTCDVQYKLNQFWREQIFLYKATQGNDSTFMLDVENVADSTTLTEFKGMLAARCSFEDIVTTALKKRNNAFIGLALKHGISINHKTGFSRRTMLQHVCRDGDIKKCKYLLQTGCRVNLQDSLGSTALHLAVQPVSRFHPLEIIEELLKKGAKVNMVDKHGHTALHLACIIGSKEIIEILLKHHAMPHIKDKKGKLAIDYTKSALHRDFCELVSTYCARSHQEKMWAHITALGFSESIMKLATASCEICLRSLTECLDLKSKKYRYWLFAHHRMSKEIVRTADAELSGDQNNSSSVDKSSEEIPAEPEDEDAPFKF